MPHSAQFVESHPSSAFQTIGLKRGWIHVTNGAIIGGRGCPFPFCEAVLMPCCPHCRHETADAQDQCLHCGTDLLQPVLEDAASTLADDTQPYEPIARFANIAEAGYFHCELEGRLDCDVRLNTQEHFDAPTASWWNDYVLTVPATAAEESVVVLKQLVAETDQADFLTFDTEPPARQTTLADDDPVPESRIHWTPIVLTLTAGTFVIWAANEAQLHMRDAAGNQPNRVNVWDKLSESPQPWVQRLNDGRGRRELSVDPDRRFATLREDTDGDGIFDRVFRLPLTQQQ